MRVDGMNPQGDSLIQVKPATNEEKVPAQGNTQIKNPENKTQNNLVGQGGKYNRDEMTVSEKALIDAIEKANKAIEGPNKRFEFSIHKKTHEIMVKVKDNETGEVIREFPPEKILDMVAKMWEMAGIIVDERR